MEPISAAEFQRLIAGAEVLERQGGGLSALRTPGQRIIKIWQRRRGLSSDRVWPYSRRFAKNCERLQRRGITAPAIEHAYRHADTGEHILVYPMLAGTPLRALAQAGGLPLAQLAKFYAELHRRGVWFRSIHLGNVLKLDHGGFGLIDVTDVYFTRGPLAIEQRANNLGYAWAYRSDRRYFTAEASRELLRHYLECAALDEAQARKFERRLAHWRKHYERRNNSAKTAP